MTLLIFFPLMEMYVCVYQFYLFPYYPNLNGFICTSLITTKLLFPKSISGNHLTELPVETQTFLD